jgi:hypothetical protein
MVIDMRVNFHSDYYLFTNHFNIMKKLIIALGFFLLFTTAGCDQEDLVAQEESAKPVYVEVIDTDQDGQPELILGFAREDLVKLSDDKVILEGLFSSTNTRFETDLFKIDP